MDRIAVYPGSFDPMTNGHADIVERSRALFDRLYVGILKNPQKSPLFSVAERVEMIAQIYAGDEGISVQAFDGLLVDFADQVGARAIIRGLRAPTELEYELQMALMNRRLRHHVETLFMVPREEFTFVSSSLVKEVFSFGGSIEGLVPPQVEARLAAKMGR